MREPQNVGGRPKLTLAKVIKTDMTIKDLTNIVIFFFLRKQHCDFRYNRMEENNIMRPILINMFFFFLRGDPN